MKTKYDVFLRMKNAKADGVYDFDTQKLTVKEGAIFEEEISESFRKHPYLKHRRELLDSEAVEDFRLIQDYEFNSPSAAAAIIVGRPMGPQDWKTSEGITLKRLIERRERLDDFKSFINENNIDFEEFKTLIWGVMNEKSEMYSPVYSFYFIDNLEKYKKIKRKYEKREVSDEVEFNKEQVIEKNKEDKGDDFFNGL